MAIEELPYRFRIRGGTSADLTTVNEVPLRRELCVELDTGKMKLGDGVTPWNDLPYVAGGGGVGVWHEGAGAPAASVGSDGDYYLDTITGDVYAKAVGAYTLTGNIRGPNPVAGAGITIDSTNPQAPIVINDGVRGLTAGTGVSVDATDPHNPVVSAMGGGAASLSADNAGAGIVIDDADPAVPIIVNDGVRTITAGSGVSINAADPHNPIISATGGGGGGGTGYISVPTDSTFASPINLTTEGNLDWAGITNTSSGNISPRKRFGNRIGTGNGLFTGFIWLGGGSGITGSLTGWGWSGGLPAFNDGDSANSIGAGTISNGVYKNCTPGDGLGFTVEADTTDRVLRIYYSNGLPFRISASLSDESAPAVSAVFNTQVNGVAKIIFRSSKPFARLNVSMTIDSGSNNLALSCVTLGTQ